MEKPLVVATYVLTPEGREAVHEILCEMADYLAGDHYALCELVTDVITDLSYDTEIDENSSLLESVINNSIDLFQPDDCLEGGYFWPRPVSSGDLPIETTYEQLEAYECRLTAVAFLIAMNETGDL